MGDDPDNQRPKSREPENPDHDREEVPGRPAVSPENLEEQQQEEEQEREGPGERLRRFLRRMLGGGRNSGR